jgi:threonine/homoserine/homoserine lactone efflux protein
VEFDARIAAFVLLSALLIVTPAPDTALIVRNALAAGPRPSTFSAIGVGIGTLVWVSAATLGVGVLLEQSSIAFTALKLAGGVYLCYLGVRTLLSTHREADQPGTSSLGRAPLSDWTAFQQGLVSNLLNPKTGAFFVVVMPQFLMPGDTGGRLTIMVGAFEVMLLAWLIAYGHVVSRLGLTGPGIRVRRAMTRLTGAVLIALGARLAFERR